MALTPRTTVNELFVRWSDDGSTVQGIHVAERQAIVDENGTEVASKMLAPRNVAATDAEVLAAIGSINAGALAQVSGAQAALVAEQEAHEATKATLAQAQAQLVALTPQVVNGVPQQLDRDQAQLGLLQDGLLDTVEAAVKAAGRAAQILYDRPVWKRDSPLIEQLAGGLGLTDATLDDMFVRYSKL